MKRSIFRSILNDLNDGKRAALHINVNGKIYNRIFIPRDRLIILGCGHVSQALCKLASMLDFEIVVVDDRPSFANSQLFPVADKIICAEFTDTIRSLALHDSDYVCVVTRGHSWDQQCIEEILKAETMPYYLGMISSRHRALGLKDLLSKEGFSEDRIKQIHSPIGLEIGAVTVPEIAVSICAELIQCRRLKSYTVSENDMIQTNADMDMLHFLAEGSDHAALLTVVSSTDSTPVKSGAVMAVNMLGKGYGTIGGGCGEAAAISRSRRIIGTGKSELIDLDMSNEVAADHEMVCGGKMQILIEDITD